MLSFIKTIKLLLFLLSLKPTVSLRPKRPIIGILTQEPCLGVEKHFKEYKSYLPASYVKSVEASGAAVFPIFIGETESYYRKVMGQINGVVIPGGGASFYAEDGYAKAGAMIYNIAKELNDKTDFFPIVGISLGMQLLIHISNGEVELRTRCDCFYENLPLDFTANFKQSTLFSRAPMKILQELSVIDITHNWHVWCVTPENFTDFGLNHEWNILSTNMNDHGITFISAVEHKIYPFIGLQFHPEKSPFEFNESQNIPNSKIAIEISRYFFDWFATQAKKNLHTIDPEVGDDGQLIVNYCPTHINPELNIGYEQLYLFHPSNNTV